MIIIFGTRLAGKVDAVPRIGHVATRFFHVYYVPLIPLGTVFLTPDQTDETGVPLPLSGKSILVGWLRSAAWVGLIAAAVLLLTGISRAHPGRLGLGVSCLAACTAGLWLLYRLRPIVQASYQRATEIVQQIGLSPEQRLMVEIAYGRMSADQAERELMKMYEAAP
jgi:hypothetical protein